MGVDTHKVEIVPVVLQKHPDADRLSIVKVYNFSVVVNTEDWKDVTKAAYVQPDSVMPDTPEYRFLKETSNLRKEREELRVAMEAEHESDLARLNYDEKIADLEKRIDKNTKYLRIAVKRLRGVISMGMLLPIPECELCKQGFTLVGGKYHVVGTYQYDIPGVTTPPEERDLLCLNHAEIGDDVAAILGITHYEPPTVDEVVSRRHTGDDVAPAPPMIYAPKFDVESVYRYADCFDPGEPVYVTEKIDGQNGRFVAVGEESGVCHCGAEMEGHPVWDNHSPKDMQIVAIHAGSRTEWKKKEGGSNWWRVMEQNPWIKEWCHMNEGKVLYGELYGWVQSLKYGANQGQLYFRAFDIMDGTAYIGPEEFMKYFPETQRVPCLGIMPFNFEALQALADGSSLVPGAKHMREGIVIKPLVERQHYKLGRVMVKMVSNAYLEKSAR